jgi:SAM-dependent methyltransferase
VSSFDDAAASYDRLRPAGAQWQAVAERTLEHLGGATRLLDVGCGTGRFAVLASERLGARVWGVDASARMLDQARARQGAAAVGWRRAEAGRLPFRAGWFDAAHMHLVAHLIEDRGAAWEDLARVLAPGGRFVLVTFEPESFRDHYLIRWFPSVAPIDEARFPTVSELEGGLGAAGFTDVAFEAFAQRWTMAAADVLERVRGRYISTLRLVPDAEFAAGVRAAGRDLAEGGEVKADLRWLFVTARAGR